jgi:(4-(4-[2-(gamma-L-glutamylamino)ethyl]phenoxymethyl)furan-2-yl)methanamine synthase
LREITQAGSLCHDLFALRCESHALTPDNLSNETDGLGSPSYPQPDLEPTTNPWVGIDIGGANLKAAHTSGWSRSVAFPMWQQWKSLAVSIAELLSDCPPIQGVAITMTGELADCFATRAQGVAVILEQVTSIVPAAMVRVYGVDGSWRTASQAAREPWSVAASNWHGLATYASRWTGQRKCLLMDVGSTTTDIIPMEDGMIALDASTDSQRLQTGSLVYTGVERSNVAGIVRQVTLFGVPCPVMNELFATTRDVYLWLRELVDAPEDCETADHQPATRAAARYRLARVVGEDGSTLADFDIDCIANEIFHEQTQMIALAIERVLRHPVEGKKTGRKKSVSAKPAPRSIPDCVVLSGHGDFLIDAALASRGWEGERIRLCERLGPELSRCAPAYAISILASEQFQSVGS